MGTSWGIAGPSGRAAQGGAEYISHLHSRDGTLANAGVTV